MATTSHIAAVQVSCLGHPAQRVLKWALALLVCLSLHGACRGNPIGTSTYLDIPEPLVSQNGTAPTVLVLGSGGLVGSALVAELKRRGYSVLEARDRMHLDLRVKGSLSRFNEATISFCFFLACEVGGSKFIATGANEKAITRNNEKIYDNVFPYLQQRKIPFLFSSSQLSVTGSAYGKIKAVGEELISKMPDKLGKFVRFWNVWGAEKVGLKSHILADWIYQCVKFRRVQSHTSGLEQRQFVHTVDMASALIDLMLSFDKLPVRVDITSGEWVSMRHMASILAEQSPHPCAFHFTSRNSSTMIGIEPKYLWKVSSPLHQRVAEAFEYYETMVQQEDFAPHDTAPYLSIIIATTNDDYNGIRQRTFNFIQGLVAHAEVSHLNYELIVVQYNPVSSTNFWERNDTTPLTAADFQNDLPFSQLFPWTSPRSFGRMRIITIPSSLHRWPDKGSFWEYVAKNAGAFRARGQFLLLTNPDDLFPLVLIEQLSKQQLNPKKVYKAGVVLNFKGQGTLAGMLGACNDLAAALYGSVTYPGNVSFLPDDELAEALAGYSNTKVLMGDGKPYWRQECVGDFSIFPRDLFLGTAGYAEMAQNKHIDTAHLVATYNDPLFKAGDYSMGFLDSAICHQDHTRFGRPSSPTDIAAVTAAMAQRTDRATSGLRSVNLPEARVSNIFTAGYNPETPFQLYPHHHLFRMFEGKLWMGEVQKDYITDFLGIRTAYSFDCQDYDGYRYHRLSRRIPCARHDEYLRANFSQLGLQVVGDLPVIDEEYFNWLSLLRAVKHKLSQPRNNPFIAAELGARYGSWTVRAGAIMRALQPFRPVQLLAVEAGMPGFKRLQEHLRLNGLAHVTQAIRTSVSGQVTNATQQEELDSQAEAGPSLTLGELLAGYDHVDIIHCDNQAWEHAFLSNTSLMDTKVGAIHFRMHSSDSHTQLRDAFVRNGWRVTVDILSNGGQMPGSLQHTGFGPIRILSHGILAFQNPRQLTAWSQRLHSQHVELDEVSS